MKNIEDIRIVIIEDDGEKRQELAEILRSLGIPLKKIYMTKYAEKGIEIIEEELPDVVLLDLKIPYNEEDERIQIDNANKVIKAIERLNGARNFDDESTGIIIISASIDDRGVQNQYRKTPEVLGFFDKDEIALNEKAFKNDLLKKIHQIAERNFRHITQISIKEIWKVKFQKLQTINEELYSRISQDLLGQYEKLNNKKSNTNQIVENIIGLSGKIVEDIINLIENKEAKLSDINDSDNFISIRNKLNHLTGRRFAGEGKFEIIGDPIITRKAAEFASFAYKLRSEAIHTKEGDIHNNKIFKESEYSLEDATISISLIMPIIHDFIKYMNNN